MNVLTHGSKHVTVFQVFLVMCERGGTRSSLCRQHFGLKQPHFTGAVRQVKTVDRFVQHVDRKAVNTGLQEHDVVG